MRSASTGTRAALPSRHVKPGRRRAGFTLIEALVALALLLAFAGALGPYMFQARRIAMNADGRVAAHILLRSLLEAPFERSTLANVTRTGQAGALRWRIVTEPMAAIGSADGGPWSAFRVTASVSWGPDQTITAETMRLAGSP
ncbi:MAG: prepilin-type N-terminal cleavage/methylation domain-containing protein [Hyphomicrobiaceae bacterium]|nr:prepilin-type N-terminal cleavage/methylation domain-containing protein [Hyphomicrobiaceae bacterium]